MPISRLRLKDLQESRFPAALGICATDTVVVADAVNAAQERLLTCREAGEHGWYGSYAEMVFNVSQSEPNLVLPRGIARLISVTACDYHIPTRNQFYEYLEFGSGLWPKLSCSNNSSCIMGDRLQGYSRGTTPTSADLTTPGYGLRFYSNVADDAMRVLVSAKDSNSQRITTLDNATQVDGCFATLTAPFVDLILPGTTTGVELSEILGIQKDVTLYPVSIYEVNLTTGAENLLLTMEPGETVAAYQKYYFDALPLGCCGSGTSASTVQLKAMVKLDLVPVRVPTDYLLIQSKEALIAEGQSMRFADMDSANAKAQSAERHTAAVRYLQGQLTHYEGKSNPAISFAPFGRSRLSIQRIGQLQ